MKHLLSFNESNSDTTTFHVEFMIGDGDWYVDFDYQVSSDLADQFENILKKIKDHDPDYILGKRSAKMKLSTDEKQQIEDLFSEITNHLKDREAKSYVSNSNYFFLTNYKKV